MPTKLGLSITSAPQAGHRQKSVVLQYHFQQHTLQAAVRHQRLYSPGVEAQLAASEAPKGASDHQDEFAEPAVAHIPVVDITKCFGHVTNSTVHAIWM